MFVERQPVRHFYFQKIVKGKCNACGDESVKYSKPDPKGRKWSMHKYLDFYGLGCWCWDCWPKVREFELPKIKQLQTLKGS